MKIITKIILVLSLVGIVIAIMPTDVCAADPLGEIFTNAKKFVKDDEISATTATINQEDMQEVSNIISKVLLTVAVIVAMISTSVIGIRFMINGVEEKAKIKETMIPFIIGMMISFGAYAFWKIALQIYKTIM